MSSPKEVPAKQSAPSNATSLAERGIDAALHQPAFEKLTPATKAALRRELAPWITKWVKLLDEAVRIPGTDIHIGLDPILGLIVPGGGDVMTGAGSVVLFVVALKERIPTVAIGRMILNVLIDTVVGVVPVLGDAFDVFFRSNRRNLDIIEKYRENPKAAPSALDYVLVYGGIALAVLGMFMPLVVGIALGAGVARWLAGGDAP